MRCARRQWQPRATYCGSLHLDGFRYRHERRLVAVGELQVPVRSKSQELRFLQTPRWAEAAPLRTVLRKRVLELLDRCIGAAEAADPALSSPVEPEEREDMDMEAVAHGLVLLVVHLQEQHIRVPLGELRNLWVESAAATAAGGEEVDDDELVAGVAQGVSQVLRGLDLPHVWMRHFLPPPHGLTNRQVPVHLASSRHMETPRLGLARKRHPPGGEGALGSVRAAHRHGLRERRRGAQVPARHRDAAVAAQSVSHGYTELVLPGTEARSEQR